MEYAEEEINYNSKLFKIEAKNFPLYNLLIIPFFSCEEHPLNWIV